MGIEYGIVGCGAVGSLVASALAAAGQRVVMYCQRPGRARLLAREGVRVRGDGRDSLAKVEAHTISRLGVDKPRYVVLALRTGDTLKLSETVTRYAEEVVYVQPSITLSRAMREEGRGLLALYSCAWIEEETVVYVPGVVAASGGAASEAARALERLGFSSRIYLKEDRLRLLWDYAAAHAATQPVATLLGVPLGKLSSSSYAMALVDRLAREAAMIMEAAGVKPLRPVGDAARELLRLRGCYPRMLADIESGRETEVQYMNGALAAEGFRLDVYASYNDAVYILVKSLEQVREVKS